MRRTNKAILNYGIIKRACSDIDGGQSGFVRILNKAGINITRQTLNNWKRGRGYDRYLVLEIANYLGIDEKNFYVESNVNLRSKQKESQ